MSWRPIKRGLLVAGLLLGAAAGLSYAHGAGLVGGDQVRRIVQAAVGLILAAYGNVIPKRVFAGCGADSGAAAQGALRVSGWAFALAGLAYAVTWAAAPLAIAWIVSIVEVAFALAISFAALVWALRAHQRESRLTI